MKLKKVTLTVAISCILSLPMMAAPSINDMQTCQGLLSFIDGKLSPAPSKYPNSDVKIVKLGLKQYNDYIQKEFVTPGLVKFNKGDISKANAMQKQVDTYKSNLVKGLNARYPQDRLFMDHAIALNNCAKQAVPSGQALENLKDALNTIIKLSKIN